MRLHASKLDLPLPTSSFPSPSPYSPAAAVSSLLFEPSSRSLALMLADSSALLYSSLSPNATRSPSPTAIPPPSTAACFLHLLPSNRVLFLSASPLAAGSAVQLSSWILLPSGGTSGTFAPARLDFRNERGRSTVAIGLRHGHTVRLAGSVNAFVIHSFAANQIWVLAARIDLAEETTVHLMKCAIVELTLPIYTITLSMGFLLLGEVDGVRVFPLRPLIKGKIAKTRGLGHAKASDSVGEKCMKNLANALVVPKSNSLGPESSARDDCRGVGRDAAVEGKADGCSTALADKLKTMKLRQDAGDLSLFFVVTKSAELQNHRGGKAAPKSSKVVRIHVLTQKKYLILDSAGDLHVLNLNVNGMSLEPAARLSMPPEDVYLHHLDNVMEVQLLATLPDTSKTQFVWLSDGGYSIHLISMDDTESAGGENDKDESKQKAHLFSVMGAILTSEKIQDIVPISTNSCLVLCQGNIFIYGVA